MKFRLFALILALSLVGWAQDTPAASAAPNSTPVPHAKACCHQNMAGKDGKSAAITPRPTPRMPQPVAAKTSVK